MAKQGLTCELRSATTGKRIAWTWNVTGSERWEWISRTIAEQFECGQDDVGCCDTDEQWDCIVVPNKGIVAYMVTELLTVGS